MTPRSRGSSSPILSEKEKLIDIKNDFTFADIGVCRRKRRCFLIVAAGLMLTMLLGYIPLYCTINNGQENFQFAWNANTSRDLSLYASPGNFTALLPNNKLCQNKTAPYLLVIVTSAIERIQARLSIRDTWGSVFRNGSYLGHEVRLAFLIGKPVNESFQDRIIAESNAFGDIIQENFIDTYQNLTVKSVMMLKWVSMFCSDAEYVLKIDDDVYLDVENLLGLLKAHGRKDLIGGSLFCNVIPIRTPSSKWYCPKFIFSDRVYPPYVSGTAYVLSGDIVPKLFSTALSVPLVHLEDVFLTGIVAQKAGLFPVHLALFDHNKVDLQACAYKVRTTVHGVEPAEMRFIWSELHLPNIKCDSVDFSKLKVQGCITKRVLKQAAVRVVRRGNTAFVVG